MTLEEAQQRLDAKRQREDHAKQVHRRLEDALEAKRLREAEEI